MVISEEEQKTRTDQSSVVETSAMGERNKISKQAFNYTRKRRQENGRPKKRDGQRKTEQKVFFFLSRRKDDCNDDNDFTTLI